MRFAAAHGYILMTHDLDFGAMIAASGLSGPSVLQIHIQDVLPDSAGLLVLNAITAFAKELDRGALVTVTKDRGRVRLLPFGQEVN